MTPQTIFAVQFALSLVVWGVIFAVLVGPRLARLERREALMWLLLPHTFRHIGLVFLVPGVVTRPLPDAFGPAAAYGDLAAGLLALLAFIALHARWHIAAASVWLFNLVGVLDLANALRQPEPIPMFGAAWYIPTMVVPLLLVTHYVIFEKLVAREPSVSPQALRTG